MTTLSLKPGSIVYYRDEKSRIIATVDEGQLLISVLSTGEQLVVAFQELTSAPANTQAEKPVPLDHIPEKSLKIARSRFEVIKPLLDPGRTKAQVGLRADQFSVSSATVYRWIGAYEETNSIASLVPNHKERGVFKTKAEAGKEAKGKDSRRIDPAVEAIIEKTIEDEYLKPQQKAPIEVYKEVVVKCRNAGLKPPGKSTVANRIKELPDKLVQKRRRGRKASSSKYQSAAGSFPGVIYPLDTVQIDHTPLDIILVDEIHRKPIGKAWVTLAIDVCSRMVFGFYISLDPPCFFSVGQTLLTAILPKDLFLKKLKLSTSWEIFGIPRTIHCDNAGEFRSEDFALFCQEYTTEMVWRPVARPEYGGHIERLAGTLNKAIHTLPGTTFSNIEQKGDYKPDQEACFTISGLEHWLSSYILETYHNEIHSALGMTPRQKYRAGILGDEIKPGIGLPDIVEDQQRLKLFLLPGFNRTIQREGVSLDGIKYFHDSLRRWINAKDAKGNKRKFVFKRDPRDISKLYLYHPDHKQYSTIPYRHLGHPSMSIWELRAINRELHDQRVKRVDEFAIFEAYEKRKRITREEVVKTKKARREREAAKHRKRKLADERVHVQVASAGKAGDGITRSDTAGDIFADIKPFEGIEVLKREQEDRYGNYDD